MPGLIDISKAKTKHCILFVEDEGKHYEMINGETHEKRFVTREQFQHIRSSEILLQKAKEQLDFD